MWAGEDKVELSTVRLKFWVDFDQTVHLHCDQAVHWLA